MLLDQLGITLERRGADPVSGGVLQPVSQEMARGLAWPQSQFALLVLSEGGHESRLDLPAGLPVDRLPPAPATDRGEVHDRLPAAVFPSVDTPLAGASSGHPALLVRRRSERTAPGQATSALWEINRPCMGRRRWSRLGTRTGPFRQPGLEAAARNPNASADPNRRQLACG